MYAFVRNIDDANFQRSSTQTLKRIQPTTSGAHTRRWKKCTRTWCRCIQGFIDFSTWNVTKDVDFVNRMHAEVESWHAHNLFCHSCSIDEQAYHCVAFHDTTC